jgi:oligo-1,6-glucosidase
MLATVLHLMKGTPYVYQGEEIGMTNASFASADDFRDIETRNLYREHIDAGLSPEEFIVGANANGRDNARTPMQWSADAPYAGFSTAAPWIGVNPNYSTINAAAAVADESSIWAHYRKLIALRREHDVIVYGRYQSWAPRDQQLLLYTRHFAGKRLIVVANFSATPITRPMPRELLGDGVCIISNLADRDHLEADISLQPYEAFALLTADPAP